LLPNREVKQREIPGPSGQLPPNPVSQISTSAVASGRVGCFVARYCWPFGSLGGPSGLRSVIAVAQIADLIVVTQYTVVLTLHEASATSLWQRVRSG